MKPPCKDCLDRKPGCAIDCPKWAEYLVERDGSYEIRAMMARQREYTVGKKIATLHRKHRTKRR
jgi:hypothetical protein